MSFFELASSRKAVLGEESEKKKRNHMGRGGELRGQKECVENSLSPPKFYSHVLWPFHLARLVVEKWSICISR